MARSGYNYEVERVMAPNVVEFYVRTPQGHRIVSIFLDGEPRFLAYNEIGDSERTPAMLYESELNDLIKRAREL